MQLIVDGADADAAQLMLFYRWRRTPPLQILVTLHKERSDDGRVLAFSSDDGMPLVALLRFEAAPEARGGAAATVVTLELEYALPNVLVEYIGKLGIEMHVDGILRQNLDVSSLPMHHQRALPLWHMHERTLYTPSPPCVQLCAAHAPWHGVAAQSARGYMQRRHAAARSAMTDRGRAGVSEADRGAADAGHAGGMVRGEPHGQV